MRRLKRRTSSSHHRPRRLRSGFKRAFACLSVLSVLGCAALPSGCFMVSQARITQREIDRASKSLGGKSKIELRELAISSPDKYERLAAVQLLESSFYLRTIAIYSHYSDAREAALDKLKYQSDLAYVASFSRFGDTQFDALQKLEKPYYLLLVIQYSDKPIRSNKMGRLAIEKLAEQIDSLADLDALLYVAMYSCNKKARFIAINRLEGNSEALETINKSSPFPDSRELAKKLMMRQTMRLELNLRFMYIASYSENIKSRSIAVDLIKDVPFALHYVAVFSDFDDSRTYAMHRLESMALSGTLTNRVALGYVYLNSENPRAREAATRILRNQGKSYVY